jgi:hypothetical protein
MSSSLHSLNRTVAPYVLCILFGPRLLAPPPPMSYYQLACSPACQPEPNKSQRMQRLLLYSLKCLSVWVCVWEKINVPNLKFEYLSNHWSDLPQILNLSLGDQAQIKNASNEDDLQWKTTLNGRWPQNIKSGISQQPLIGSSSNFKLKLSLGDQTKI